MITLSSDFGSPYPAAMKGVVLRRTDAQLVDVAHDFPRHDVRGAAFWLREVLPWFPPAVHLVVVDPGVGTDRGALAVRAADHAFVGPDNGVLLPAARETAADTDAVVEIFEVEYETPASNTFHGRDLFAPVAADVHDAGVEDLETLDAVDPTDTYEDLTFPEPDVRPEGVVGEVLVVDGFGNVVTNVPGGAVSNRYGEDVLVDGEPVTVARSYAHVGRGDRLVTVGSHGNVELTVNRGRGDEAFGIGPGDTVELVW